MRKRITLNILDRKSVRSAIKQTEAYRQAYDRVVEAFLDAYCKAVVQTAREYAEAEQPIHSEQLIASIAWDETGKYTRRVYVGDPAAKYFEFGTGPRGAANPHPDPPEGWSYRKSPWFTQADGKPMDELYGWKPLYNSTSDTVFYRTAGQPAHPFWYKTIQTVTAQEYIDKIWQEVRAR